VLKQVGSPLKFSETPGSLRLPPPVLGQHTDAILGGDLGFTADEIAAMRSEGTV
jgi:crotonobetainyl-CoA:carnitine CoA-transferase CaiB-like acyl-CoA transferase